MHYTASAPQLLLSWIVHKASIGTVSVVVSGLVETNGNINCFLIQKHLAFNDHAASST